MAAPSTTTVAVPRWTRWFVYGFLGLVLVCGLARIEAWPLTGFRLFSSVRTAERVSWHIVAVDPDDGERTISLGELPVAYRNTTTLIAEFDTMSQAERDEVCDAWARPLEDRGESVESVRIYRRTALLGRTAPPPTRERVWECGR